MADVAADVLGHEDQYTNRSHSHQNHDHRGPEEVGYDRDATHNRKVTTNGPRSRSQRVSGAEQLATDLDDLAALPDHGADGARAHVGDQALEEGLVRQVGVVLLEMLLARGHELDGDELEAVGCSIESEIVVD